MSIRFNKTRWWAARWGSGLIGIVLLMAIAWVLSAPWYAAHRLRGLSYDLPLAWRSPVKIDQAIIVAMDESSYGRLAQDPAKPWNRNLHADLLGQLAALGARAAVFDITFLDKWPDPKVDQRFAQAIKDSGLKVVLAAKLQENEEGSTMVTSPLIPVPPLDSAAPSGLVDIRPDPDGTVRQHFVYANYPTLSWRVAALLGEAPPDPHRARWLNLYGPRGTVPRRSYYEFLGGTNVFPAGFLSNRVVFVGRNPVVTPRGESVEDEFRVATAAKIAGAEIQATAYLNLARRDWLEELPGAAQAALFLGSAVVFGLGLPLLRPWWAAPAALLGAGVVTLAALWLVWEKQNWFPWLVIVCGQIPGALLWAMIVHTHSLAHEKADLEARLATSLGTAGAAGNIRAPRKLIIPDYTLLRCVGSGGYGDVWLARDLVGSYRAVKAVFRDRFRLKEPFEREFRGIQKYSPISRTHPGWIDILHVGRIEGDAGFFYIMELGDDAIAGNRIDPDSYVSRTLAGDLQRRGRLPLEECLQLSLILAGALEHLHQHLLIHRDIKPSNVIFVGGQPKFADIGLVTDTNAGGSDVSFVGTEGYVAPEGPGVPAADIFSFGKLIYEATTGRDRRAFPELPTALATGPADRLTEELYRIALKCCEGQARHRYPTAAALQADLLRLKESLVVGGKT